MPEHELEKLLGAFAADTVTAEEREMLYRAALQDQRLFNALADEQALKELLTDPAVRSKLLRVLNQQGTHRSTSWLDRVIRPSTVAWTGGVAVGVFAVVLGLKVYEDSMRQAADTATLEEGRPPASAPPALTPRANIESTESRKPAPIPEPGSKAPSSRTMKTREQPTPSQPQDASVRDADREKTASPPAPAAALNRDAPAETPGAPPTGASARALFHSDGTAPEQMDSTLMEKEAKPEPRPERFALTRKDSPESVKPLAFRYRIITEKRRSESESAADRPDVIRLTVESNQGAYLQIWRSTGESLPELVLPAKETGRISAKTAAGQRQEITVEGETDRLIVRLSRVPFGPMTRQEAVMAGRSAQGQVVESAVGTEEPATYVANPDSSVAELAADIFLSPAR